MSTNKLSAKQIDRSWHLIDAKSKVLGRLATQIATLLMGKRKSNFVPYLDMGDNVVVINAKEVMLSGKKESQKRYVRHSGYPGGYKEESAGSLRVKAPEEIIRHAVKGMIPKTKLGRQMIKKMRIFAGAEHPFAEQFKAGGRS